jgi:hypothetical protein
MQPAEVWFTIGPYTSSRRKSTPVRPLAQTSLPSLRRVARWLRGIASSQSPCEGSQRRAWPRTHARSQPRTDGTAFPPATRTTPSVGGAAGSANTSLGPINRLIHDVQQLLHMVIPVILQNVILCVILSCAGQSCSYYALRGRCIAGGAGNATRGCAITHSACLSTCSRLQRLLRRQHLHQPAPGHSERQPPALVRVVRDDWRRVVLAHLSLHERILGHALGRRRLEHRCLIFCRTQVSAQQANHLSTSQGACVLGLCLHALRIPNKRPRFFRGFRSCAGSWPNANSHLSVARATAAS